SLPTYPFERQRYWVDARRSKPHRAKPEHLEFNRRLDLTVQPWLADHRVFGSIVVPAAYYLEMALAAGGEMFAEPVLEDVELRQVLVLDGREGPVRIT